MAVSLTEVGIILEEPVVQLGQLVGCIPICFVIDLLLVDLPTDQREEEEVGVG